ncbi:protein-tyrosine phosphatase-like protein [Daedaleopsis nitida]|nr:protein-tyrosine phosphatase-like protein [Daedaleopsis nitida]
MSSDPLLPQGALLDPHLVASTLSAPPFVSIDGIPNVRDFGAGYPSSLPSPTASDSTPSPTRTIIKPRTLFRSGEPSRITPQGVEQLRALGIRKIFDLRADVEVAKYGSVASALGAVEGVDVVRAPILDEAMDPVGIAKRLKDFSEDEAQAFLRMNTYILKSGGPAVQKLLVHLRDHPDEPCLVHCTAGKDRSGMLAAVILLLLGAREEDVVADYALTTVGLQPMLPLLIARFQKEDVYRDNWQGALNIATAKPRSMEAVIEMLRREYGGVEGYIRQHTALTDDDIARVRANLLVPVGSGDDA